MKHAINGVGLILVLAIFTAAVNAADVRWREPVTPKSSATIVAARTASESAFATELVIPTDLAIPTRPELPNVLPKFDPIISIPVGTPNEKLPEVDEPLPSLESINTPNPPKEIPALLPATTPVAPLPASSTIPFVAPLTSTPSLNVAPSNVAPSALPRFPMNPTHTTREADLRCDDTVGFRPIKDISCDIHPDSANGLPKECPMPLRAYQNRNWQTTCFHWKASALATKGAYFENVKLERYGQSCCPILEPVISGAKFFVTVPFLPYKAGLQLPNECVYTLGHYRVGDCAPYMLDPLPLSVRAGLFQAGATVGVAAMFP